MSKQKIFPHATFAIFFDNNLTYFGKFRFFKWSFCLKIKQFFLQYSKKRFKNSRFHQKLLRAMERYCLRDMECKSCLFDIGMAIVASSFSDSFQDDIIEMKAALLYTLTLLSSSKKQPCLVLKKKKGDQKPPLRCCIPGRHCLSF